MPRHICTESVVRVDSGTLVLPSTLSIGMIGMHCTSPLLMHEINPFRFNLYKIEQELGTEIQPIPPIIDKKLYVYDSPETIPRPPPAPQQQNTRSAQSQSSGNQQYQVKNGSSSPTGRSSQTRPRQYQQGNNQAQYPSQNVVPQQQPQQPQQQQQQQQQQQSQQPQQPQQPQQGRRPPRYINQQQRSNGFSPADSGPTPPRGQ